MSQTKKAKLAHDKKRNDTPQVATGQFTFKQVLGLVDWPKGQTSALVVLDGEGTVGLVDGAFVTRDRATGDLRPVAFACPAAYDAAARQQAIRRHADYQLQHSPQVH